ncbi:unnamed protein product [Brassicogethes aeneus]|uniref:C2H2-type domain-containing protein n=1 Tax=Brassicogethes aeneus TaxID=1431903 RepID=A0A9P0FLU0_BRAAE|nr:unnamed protein product [Brassicogethes aeneus]
MSLFKSDSQVLLTCVDVNETNMDEELYTTNFLEKTKDFDDWMKKAGVDCFFTKNNFGKLTSQDSTSKHSNNKNDIEYECASKMQSKKQAKDMKKPNILRSHNTKIDRNMNALQDNIRRSFKCDILSINEAKNVFMTFTSNVCYLIIKDSDDQQIFAPQKIQVNNSSVMVEDGQSTTKQEITSVKKVDIAKSHVDVTLPQILTNVGAKFCLCPLLECQEGFHDVSTARIHALRHMGVKPYQCNIPNCSWKFYTLFKLQRHQETHSRTKSFVCSHKNCDRSFTTAYNLKHHEKAHIKPLSLDCPVDGCEERFQNEKDRRTHYKTHNAKEAPFKCTEAGCEKSFFTHTALLTHMRSHNHKDSELNCNFPNCGRSFNTPYRLKEHLRTHTGQKPYVCEYKDCTWRFMTASKLRRHQCTHTKDRKFHCTIGSCTKSFIRSEHLREHTLTHIGQKTFDCEACNISIVGKSNICTHRKKYHPEITIEMPSTSKTADASVFLSFTTNCKSDKTPQQDVLLEQAIQSLDVVNTNSDLSILGSSCLLPEDLLESDVNFSTVNLRDLD